MAMPLLDHFLPPLHPTHHWGSFHSNWATRIADLLNDRWLSSEFLAEEHTRGGGRLEIDVATYEKPPAERPFTPANGAPAATVAAPSWAPPVPALTLPASFPANFEVRVLSNSAGLTLVAAIELISPSNKDRPEERRAFAAKCMTYLRQGVAVVLMDIVTSRPANLHNETMRLMESAPESFLPDESRLYAVSYRPVLRDDRPEIDVWTAPVAVGAPLPTLPLRLTGDLFVPVEFEPAYMEACRRRRLA
jgi:hypothetical protein